MVAHAPAHTHQHELPTISMKWNSKDWRIKTKNKTIDRDRKSRDKEQILPERLKVFKRKRYQRYDELQNLSLIHGIKIYVLIYMYMISFLKRYRLMIEIRIIYFYWICFCCCCLLFKKFIRFFSFSSFLSILPHWALFSFLSFFSHRLTSQSNYMRTCIWQSFGAALPLYLLVCSLHCFFLLPYLIGNKGQEEESECMTFVQFDIAHFFLEW